MQLIWHVVIRKYDSVRHTLLFICCDVNTVLCGVVQ